MFDVAVRTLRAWQDREVVVCLEPDGTVMRGWLAEIDAGGPDEALFALSRGERGLRDTTGVAVALFRDAVREAACTEDGALVVRQGRVTLTVRPS